MANTYLSEETSQQHDEKKCSRYLDCNGCWKDLNKCESYHPHLFKFNESIIVHKCVLLPISVLGNPQVCSITTKDGINFEFFNNNIPHITKYSYHNKSYTFNKIYKLFRQRKFLNKYQTEDITCCFYGEGVKSTMSYMLRLAEYFRDFMIINRILDDIPFELCNLIKEKFKQITLPDISKYPQSTVQVAWIG